MTTLSILALDKVTGGAGATNTIFTPCTHDQMTIGQIKEMQRTQGTKISTDLLATEAGSCGLKLPTAKQVRDAKHRMYLVPRNGL